MQNFNSLASTQTDLLTIFQVNIRILLRIFQNFPILKKIQIEHYKRHLLQKFKPSSKFRKKIKSDFKFFLTSDFALEISKFQNSEYEVHQIRPTDEG
jgi:hypothetical protein